MSLAVVLRLKCLATEECKLFVANNFQVNIEETAIVVDASTTLYSTT